MSINFPGILEWPAKPANRLKFMGMRVQHSLTVVKVLACVCARVRVIFFFSTLQYS